MTVLVDDPRPPVEDALAAVRTAMESVEAVAPHLDHWAPRALVLDLQAAETSLIAARIEGERLAREFEHAVQRRQAIPARVAV